MVKVKGWMCRFYDNTKMCNKKTGELSEEELKKAELKILKKFEEDSFQGLKMQRLNSFSTFKNADGILRIKTKLIMREDDENFKVPNVYLLITLLSRVLSCANTKSWGILE
ncbi:integrase catalytic domain-containing protein [Nephila pilipes]|uniref:Integrase catalytic domain-containing protein n=1 Tax=Nephila pilipes TaxID=299642 RepID=A0A8X6MQ98_NEPPI|nr:integrase catalytic domain-containing protein [Nephila pilipes]